MHLENLFRVRPCRPANFFRCLLEFGPVKFPSAELNSANAYYVQLHTNHVPAYLEYSWDFIAAGATVGMYIHGFPANMATVYSATALPVDPVLYTRRVVC